MALVKQKIVPHPWFDRETREAANFYCSVFPDSSITNIATLHDTPSGDSDVVSFILSGLPFMAISAGPFFKFNGITGPFSATIVVLTRSPEKTIGMSLRNVGRSVISLGGNRFYGR